MLRSASRWRSRSISSGVRGSSGTNSSFTLPKSGMRGLAGARAREAPGKGPPAQGRGRVPGGARARVLPFQVGQGAQLADRGALQALVGQAAEQQDQFLLQGGAGFGRVVRAIGGREEVGDGLLQGKGQHE